MTSRAAHIDSGHQVVSSEGGLTASRVVSLWVFLSLVLWGLIIGGVYTLSLADSF